MRIRVGGVWERGRPQPRPPTRMPSRETGAPPHDYLPTVGAFPSPATPSCLPLGLACACLSSRFLNRETIHSGMPLPELPVDSPKPLGASDGYRRGKARPSSSLGSRLSLDL